MRGEDFERMMGNLRTLIDFSAQADSVESPTEEDIIIARMAQSIQDKVLKNELHHIIGMGDLTPSQTVEFADAIRELSSHRSAVKRVATSSPGVMRASQDPPEYLAECLLGKDTLIGERTELEKGE